MEVFDCLAEEGRTTITYDQLGCGNSYLDGHPELWNMRTWLDELIMVRRELKLHKCHILGQSWGGMLLLQYLVSYKPAGVLSAILSSTLPASSLWGQEQHRILRYFPREEQDAICEAEKTGNYDTQECKSATAHFMEMRCAGKPDENTPECVRRPKKTGDEAYVTAWGENEYTPSGTLKYFDVRPDLKNIQVPALIMSGTDDLCTPLIAKTMHDGIPNSSWHLFSEARHMCFIEKKDEYMQILNKWMKACENGTVRRDAVGNI